MRMSRLRPIWPSLCVFVFACASPASAQSITGSIAGTIQDPSGGGVPNATVTVTNTDDNAVLRTAKTDDSGNYSAPLLPIGRYNVTAEAAGFKKASRTRVELNVNDKLTINFSLEVGSITEQVTVQEAAVQVQTQTAEASNLISGTQIRELSLNNRNYEQLVTLMPGVSSGISDQIYIGVSNPSGQTNTVDFSINGARNSQNNWTVDGADNVDRGSNITLLNYPSVDALAEFKVLRGEYSAEFGRAGGGQINVVTKSGTSQFHGNAYEFVRNDAFAANNFLNNATRANLGSDGKAKVPPLRYNNFGYTIGGPVYIPHLYNTAKNKTFFFFSEEFRRVITYGATQAIVPTTAELQGNFPSPVCTNFAGGACQTTATQITNISPVAAAYIKDIFSKIPPGSSVDNTLFVPLRNVFNHRQELYKIDHIFSTKLAISGRYLTDKIPTIEPGGLFTGSALPGVSTTSTNSPGHSIVLRATATLSPTWLNEGGYAYSYGAIVSTVQGLVNPALSPDIKVNLPFPVTLSRVPALTFTGGSSVTGFGPYQDFDRNHEIWDNVTKIWGAHTIKFGGEIFHYQKTENNGGPNVGSFAFAANGAPKGTTAFQQSFANFLLGNVSNFSQASLDLTPDVRSWQFGMYAQDDWRIRPNFTINIGLRYSLYRQPFDAKKQLTNFDPKLYDPAKAPQINPATGNIVAGTGDPLNGISINNTNSPFGSKVSNEDSHNFAPRIGFAWDPTGTGKTSIRSGYGIYYDSILFGIYEQNIFANPPFVNSINIPNTLLDNPTAGSPTISLVPKALHGTPSNYKTPYTQQWSLDLQHQFGRSWVTDIGYFGSKGTHLIGIVDLNEVPPGLAQSSGLVPPGTQFTSANTPLLNALRPFKGYTAINSIEPWFNSNYHSLQASLEKRFSGDSLITASYTYSKDLTDNRSDRSSAPQNSYNFHEGEYGLAQFDRRHIFTASYVYDLPFFRGQKGAAGHILGGWELSGITQIGTGLPLNPAINATLDPSGLGILGPSASSPRPDWVCNPNVGGARTRAQWFNTSCLVSPPAGQVTPGNAGRSIINGPGYNRWDFSIFKNIAFRESVRLQVRGEAFNVFNHTNPLGINTTVGATTYGQITSYHDPRIIQLGAKFYF
jgi:hypothetical protein